MMFTFWLFAQGLDDISSICWVAGADLHLNSLVKNLGEVALRAGGGCGMFVPVGTEYVLHIIVGDV